MRVREYQLGCTIALILGAIALPCRAAAVPATPHKSWSVLVDSAPTVTITPSASVIATNETISLLVEICATLPLHILPGYTHVTEDSLDVTSRFTFTSGSKTGCDYYQSASTTFTITRGTHTFTAQGADWNNSITTIHIGTAQWLVSGVDPGLRVVAIAGAVTARPSAAGVVKYSVTNLGGASDTAVFGVSCTGNGATCGSAPGQLTIATGATDTVQVSYTASATSGTMETIALAANRKSSLANGDTAWANVNVQALVAPGVNVYAVTPFGIRTIESCFTYAIRPRVAYQCGNLRLTYPLPAVRSYSRVYQPTLVYTSELAITLPLVGALVTLDSTKGTPDSVVASIQNSGTTIGVTHFDTGAAVFAHGVSQRVTVGISTTALVAPNDYTLQFVVTSYYAGVASQMSTTFYYAYVSQEASHLGIGWAVAGIEGFHMYSAHTSMLWYSGDGESRYYQTLTGASPHTFYTANVSRPDTIKIDSTAGHWSYIRYAEHGTKVRFDSIGRHVQTIDRLGHITHIYYRSLPYSIYDIDHITIPSPTGTLTYQFNYQNNSGADSGYVISIAAPAVSGQPRTVQLARDAKHQMQTVTNPDLTTIGFGYAGNCLMRIYPCSLGLVGQYTSERNTVTAFVYDAWIRLMSATVDSGGSGHLNIDYAFTSAESRGLSAPVPPDSVYTLINGPRSGITVTRFWTDGYGEVTRFRDALGQETQFKRANTSYPTLITRVQDPGQQVIGLAYDARGNVDSLTDSSHFRDSLGVRTYATTTFKWDPRWDFLMTAQHALGDGLQMRYDSVFGNRQYQQPDIDTTNTTHQVKFSYGSGGNSDGLVTAVTMPGEPTAPYRISYNHLGDDSVSTTPIGFASRRYTDAIGRVVLDSEPIDSAQTAAWSVTLATYNAFDQAVTTRQFGPSMTSDLSGIYGYGAFTVPAETLTVKTVYNLPATGVIDTVVRTQQPDPVQSMMFPIGTLKESWQPDAIDRTTTHTAVDGHAEQFTFDNSNNVVVHITRNNDRVTARFDPLNRETELTLPARSYGQRGSLYQGMFSPRLPNCGTGWCVLTDSASFLYDHSGHVVRASNGDAIVARHYNRNGTLGADTSFVRTAFGIDFSQHVYGLQYVYDLDSRLVTLLHPTTIAPRNSAGTLLPTQQLTYNSEGLLQSVTDVMDNAFQHQYDADERLSQIAGPGGSDNWSFDQDGRPILRVDSTYAHGGANEFASAILHSDTIHYDARGKITLSRGYAYQQYNAYNGLGALMEALWMPHTPADPLGQFEELYVPDAFGNIAWQWNEATPNGYTPLFKQDSLQTYRLSEFNPNTGRDSITGNYVSGKIQNYQNSLFYDSAGDRVVSSKVWQDPVPSYTNPIAVLEWSYYDAAQRLRTMDFQACALKDTNFTQGPFCYYTQGLGPGQQGTFEEYRYDAFGRRVWRRGRADPNCSIGNPKGSCFSVIERTIYDGDRILYEIRQAGDDSVGVAGLERDTVTVPNAKYDQWGRVTYTYGGRGIDAPLSIVRMGYDSVFAAAMIVYPHERWDGTYDLGTFVAGDSSQCSGNDCVQLEWPAARYARYRQDPYLALGIPRWTGNLVAGGHDATNRVYLRNRYYDPETGRFTQEDPIGLAGGINSYGFGNGDPVNYSDPFGLFDVTFGDKAAEAYVRELENLSPTFKKAVEQLENNHNVLVNVKLGHIDDPYNPGLTQGSVVYSADHPAGVTHIEVTLDLGKVPALENITREAGGISVNDVVGHEIYSHALPRSRKQLCDDPPGTCAIKRENIIRRELHEDQRTWTTITVGP